MSAIKPGLTQTLSPGASNRFAGWMRRHWLLALNLIAGAYVLLPWAAPVLMKIGATAPARAIYTFYSVQCHQLPQCSYFLFGEAWMYSIPEVNAARGSQDIWTLRAFIGNEQMGYKVAYSDRMVSLYTSAWVAALIVAALRKRARPLPIFWLLLLLLPLGLDGGTHTVSDFLWGIGQGFRDTNEWLRVLTFDALPASFYVGDAWGSFNSIMRLITGVLAGFAAAWAILPRLDGLFDISSLSS